MKYKISSLKNIAIAMVLVLIIGLTGCTSNGTTATLEGSLTSDDVILELINNDTSTERDEWPQVAADVTPSVVAITSFNDEEEGGSGSGIIVSADGYIVTNSHVVSEETNNLTVILPDDTVSDSTDNITYEATLVGMDEYTDLAVIKIDVTGLTPAEFGDSDDLLVAEGVMAIGYPGGLDLSPSATVTIGYVSAKYRPIDMYNGYIINCLQTDTAINPGNSGGALVNQYGQVIGIPTSKIAATDYEGIGFAIPSVTVEEIVNDLIQNGYISYRATIGIGGILYNEYNAEVEGVPAGFLISDIYATTTSDGGLLVGDTVTTFGGIVVDSVNVINGVLQTKVPGDTVEVIVNRSEQIMTFTITLSNYNDVYGD